MTSPSIFACLDARGRQWQLDPLPPETGRVTLIGWSQPADQHDAGVPEEVARALTRGLSAAARVTFPCSTVSPVVTDVWSPSDGDLIRAIGKGIGGRLAAKLKGTPPHIALMSTRRPETVMRLFDDPGFPWWLQGQVVLLSAPDRPPPDLDEGALQALIGDGWTKQAASLASSGLEGIMRPGVDGDVAGLLSLTDAFEHAVLAALETETRRAGLDWALLSESAFTAR